MNIDEFIKELQELKQKEQFEGEKVCFEDTLNKLQELKGSDKE